MSKTQTQTEVPLDDATTQQLRRFLEVHLGITGLATTANRAQMRAKIAEAGWDKKVIFVPPDEPVAAVGLVAIEQKAGEGRVQILISKTEEPGGDEPVFTSVNGRAMWIPRGKPVWIPTAYYEVLKHAVKDVFDPDENGKMSPVPRQVMTYPVSLIQAEAA